MTLTFDGLITFIVAFLLPPQITGHVFGIILKPKTIKFERINVILATKF